MSIISLFIVVFLTTINAYDIQKQIYYRFPSESVSHCVRRLNATHSIGCSSDSNGNVGLVQVALTTNTQLRSVLDSLLSKTILVVNSQIFTNSNSIDEIVANKFINGLIVIDRNNCSDNSSCDIDLPLGFSEDYRIPNEQFSISINQSFNPEGSAFAFREWPWPVALIGRKYRDKQEKIIDCFNRFNVNSSSNRRCAIEIRNFQSATRSTYHCEKCQKIYNSFAGFFYSFSFCEDFSGMNHIVHSIDRFNGTRQPKSVLALIARLDSLSMFEKSAVSNQGALTSAALLLTVMHLLTSQAEFNQTDRLKKDVLFLFLDNESYDYLGSNRLVLDLQTDKVANASGQPINFSHLDLLLEFGEMGFSNFSEMSFFYPRFSKQSEQQNKTINYVDKLWQQLKSRGFQDQFQTNAELPPSSVQYLLRNQSIPAIVMADHQHRFKNRFYNSFLDYNSSGNYSRELVEVANAVAAFVYHEATGKNLTEFKSVSDKVTPQSIIDCFSENIRCELLKEVLSQNVINSLHALGTPIPMQAHSATKEMSNDYRLSYLLRNLIVFLSGQPVDMSECNACPKCNNLTTISSGNATKKCYRTRIETAEEFSYLQSNASLWTTSTIVEGQSVMMFVMAKNTGLLVLGLVLTFLMTAFMTLISSRSSELFTPD